MGRNSSCNRCFHTLIVARVSIHFFAWKTARNIEPWDCVENGVFPDDHPNALGVVGFMHHDYENFAFDTADLILALGFSIQQFDPKKINPHNDKTIIHINTFVEDSDAHYSTALNIRADIGATLSALTAKLREQGVSFDTSQPKIRELLYAETISCANDSAFPMKPQRVVYDTRRAVRRDWTTLVDTGALKMWMARL